jgi:2-aminoadipate transaminase
MAFGSFEADVITVPMHEVDGMDVEALAKVVSERTPKLVYTIPDFQNPTGITMSLERREALVALARERGFLVIEDVAYRDLGFDDNPPPSLWSLGPDVVVQLGTFSKTFFPGVRLGWAVGPADVIKHLTLAKQNADQCAGSLGQRLLQEYTRRGFLEEQTRVARELYRRRCELMLDALGTTMPGEVSWTSPRGGFFTWLTLPDQVDARMLAPHAMEQRVAYVAGSVFYPDGRGHNNVRLSFSNVQDEQIPEGVNRLSSLFRGAL